MTPRSRAQIQELDDTSPLAHTRARFRLPEGVVYLDGNSLGPTVTGMDEHLAAVVRREWGDGLIRAWNPLADGGGDWIGLARRIGDRIAPLIGVGPGEVHVGDSTSVTLFKTFVAAARLRPGRRVILMERGTFPTDAYVAQGVAELLDLEVRLTDDPVADLDDDVALLSLTQVDFRTGAAFDMPALTAAAHDVGALVQWDLCHSAGALDVRMGDADFAVGCTYKYLNGGPGSPAFVWVHPRHVAEARQPIPGWMGHRAPFEMSLSHEPADGIGSFASGTPPVLALKALEHALSAFDGVAMADVRRASLSLTGLFIDLLDGLPAGWGLEVVTPRDEGRGSQVSVRHPHAYGIVQALIARGVIGDYRDDGERDGIARFGFAPLYVRHADVWDAVEQLRLVMQQEEYADPAYSSRMEVT